MPNIVISIISHGHADLIINNTELAKIAALDEVVVIVKDNLPESLLSAYCKSVGIIYLDQDPGLGFGENNNIVFKTYSKIFEGSSEDWFIILNPDVIIEEINFRRLVNLLHSTKIDFITPNLFKDTNYCDSENSLRKFPTVANLMNALLVRPISVPYNKDQIQDGSCVDWASGAFLCIKRNQFEAIDGFNEDYFMYFEDVELCRTLASKNVSLHFAKHINAMHKGAYQNRRLFSKHFWWYLAGLTRFLFLKKRI